MEVRAYDRDDAGRPAPLMPMQAAIYAGAPAADTAFAEAAKAIADPEKP